MSILDWLRTRDRIDARGDTETVRRIVAELDRREPVEARRLAAFAYILSRVANADRNVSDVERDEIIEIVQRVGQLSEAQAVLIVELARTQNRLFGATEDFLVTREFREVATDDQRHQLLDCLFAVAAADNAISAEEEAEIREIAGELGFEHADYIAARLPYSDKRTVLRRPAD